MLQALDYGELGVGYCKDRFHASKSPSRHQIAAVRLRLLSDWAEPRGLEQSHSTASVFMLPQESPARRLSEFEERAR